MIICLEQGANDWRMGQLMPLPLNAFIVCEFQLPNYLRKYCNSLLVCWVKWIQVVSRPSVLWHCWLGGRKGIWCVKKGGKVGTG